MLDHINHYWNACLVYNFLWLHHKPACPNMMGTILDNSIISTDFIIINILHLLQFSGLRHKQIRNFYFYRRTLAFDRKKKIV